MEGDDLPPLTADDMIAFDVVAMLKNGMGGLDWSGLPLVAAWLGVTDIDGLMYRLRTIVTHRPKKDS